MTAVYQNFATNFTGCLYKISVSFSDLSTIRGNFLFFFHPICVKSWDKRSWLPASFRTYAENLHIVSHSLGAADCHGYNLQYFRTLNSRNKQHHGDIMRKSAKADTINGTDANELRHAISCRPGQSAVAEIAGRWWTAPPSRRPTNY